MRQINETSSIGDLINNSVFQGLKGKKINDIVKHSTIFSFWPDIIGAKFAKFTKPYSIKYSKLYVSAKSPVIVQELSLYKNKLLKKINSYSAPLGIEIKDVVFDYKNYNIQTPETLSEVEDKPVEIEKNQLENIKVDSNYKEKIEKNINRIKFLNKKQKENFITKILQNHQAKALQNNSK